MCTGGTTGAPPTSDPEEVPCGADSSWVCEIGCTGSAAAPSDGDKEPDAACGDVEDPSSPVEVDPDTAPGVGGAIPEADPDTVPVPVQATSIQKEIALPNQYEVKAALS